MVHLMKSEPNCFSKVKLEVVESMDNQLAPLHKRSKLDPSHEWDVRDDSFEIPPSMYNPLEEPSPLGLRLKKSPSLLDLIQMTLSQQKASKLGNKKDHKGTTASGNAADNKLKASNFPASILRIGTWEYKSRYEGDLVAKCYFAKHKLVWEVLDGCLKNKIEIQWSDIMAIKAKCPEDGPETLDVVLGRRPLFFREINPQPRKHTLWQATSDFSGGEASMHRRHFLQCPQGSLGKHFEKLIQCDPRLNFLSQQPEIELDSPYFEPRISVVDDMRESTSSFDKSEEEPSFFEVGSLAPTSGAQSTSSRSEQDFLGKSTKDVLQKTDSPSSVIETHAIEEIASRKRSHSRLLSNLGQIKVPGIHPSMSLTDLVSHIGNCVSEQRTFGCSTFATDNQQSWAVLEEISQYLLSDTQIATASNEQYIMSRVNSLCSLLQKDPNISQNMQIKIDDDLNGEPKGGNCNPVLGSPCSDKILETESQLEHASDCKNVSNMSRKESFGELLLDLPRIASFPQFLFNLSEDSNGQAR